MRGLNVLFRTTNRPVVLRSLCSSRVGKEFQESRFSTSVKRYENDRPRENGNSDWTRHQLPTSPDQIAPEVLEEKRVPIERHTAYISVGSNIGDRVGWIEKALNLMKWKAPIKIKRTSSLWETEPMYVVDQANFLNGVIEVRFQVPIQSGRLSVLCI